MRGSNRPRFMCQTTKKMPKHLLFIVLASLTLVSCKDDSNTENGSATSAEVIDLQNQIKQLELEKSQKDSLINESLAFFNIIKSNLEAIGVKKDEIRVISSDPERQNTDKEWILEQIRYINFLREDNARMVKQLNSEINSSGLKISELEVMISSLNNEIALKDEQINLLQTELDRLDSEYSKLFDAYQEQSEEIDQLKTNLNTVYYAYGTQNELAENGVIERKNGFVGIGKKISLKDKFNDSYFTATDAKKTKSISILGTGIRFITSHPTNSYELEVQGSKTVIRISDASEFWKISKYLVVTVD